uniref:Putative secreted protein n=1 Tax=Anopheles darlingi TaxID=43151 RepID=A0A2M4DN17_ANODA
MLLLLLVTAVIVCNSEKNEVREQVRGQPAGGILTFGTVRKQTKPPVCDVVRSGRASVRYRQPIDPELSPVLSPGTRM